MKKKYNNAGYVREFDCFFDRETLEWVEKKCSDKKCEFCSKRPENAVGLKEYELKIRG